MRNNSMLNISFNICFTQRNGSNLLMDELRITDNE